jgi:excisionase family DNA binding protein
MTVEQVATQLGMSQRFVQKRTAAGEWPHHRFGRVLRFSAEDFEEIVEITSRPAGVVDLTSVRPGVVSKAERAARIRAIKDMRASARQTG